MRSSVSYILSHAPGETVMSHPDYTQQAQHHACLLVLVKGIGGMLKNFNKLWERMQRVNNIKVTGKHTHIPFHPLPIIVNCTKLFCPFFIKL